MDFFLMRKDEIITMVQLSGRGEMIGYSEHFRNPELLPLGCGEDRSGLPDWWAQRAVPIAQGRVAAMLEEKNISCPGAYLLRNLGLSLTDYYWIRPVDVVISWNDVNLYANDFKEDMMHSIDDSCGQNGYSPNSSLQGDIEKSWQIRKGVRYLYKGNHGIYSLESANEVFASLLHKQQSYDNFVEYKPVKIRNKKYDFGCFCKAFTDETDEFIPAWEILKSVKALPGESRFSRFVRACVKNGADESQLIKDLDYMILTDYVLSNRDRHMNNIGMIRDADSLRFKRLAPIFDTGKSMFVGQALPLSELEMSNIEVNSFEETEPEMLKHVQDRKCVNPDLLPRAVQLAALYHKDSKLSDAQIAAVCESYEKKVEMFKKYIAEYQ